MTISANTRISALQIYDALTMLSRMSRKAGQACFLDTARAIAKGISEGERGALNAATKESCILRDCATGSNVQRNQIFLCAAVMLESLPAYKHEPATVYAIAATQLGTASRLLQPVAMRETTLRIFENKAAQQAFSF